MTSASARTRRLAFAASGAALAATLVLAGCSGGSGSGSASKSAGGKSASDATLNVGAILPPTNLDIRNTSGAALDQALLDNVYQGIVTLDENGKVVPSIAKSWTISSDGLAYDFTLNSGVTFSDGTKLGADDVVASLQDVIANEKTYVDAAGLVDVTSVSAPDASTVELKLDKPNIETLWALAGRAGVVLEKGAKTDATGKAVGTGPFTIGSFDGKTSLVLERNDKYWGKKAQVKEVDWHYYADSTTAESAVLAGTDQVLVAITPADLPKFSGNSNVKVVTGTASDKWQLGFNVTDPTLADQKVRDAIREAIDPKAILASVNGAGIAPGGPIAKGDPGYEDLSSIDSYDPAKAKAAFAAAGVTQLTLTIPSPYGTGLSDLLTTELKAAGVKLKVNQVDFNTWLSQVYTAGNYQLTIVDHVESHDFGTQWAGGAKYYHHYDNPKVDELYAKALAETSADAEATDLAQAAKLVDQDSPSDWLYQGAVEKAVAVGVKGLPTNNTNSRLNLGAVSIVAGSAADSR